VDGRIARAGKSASSQPLVLPGVDGITTSLVGTMSPVTSPSPEYSMTSYSASRSYTLALGVSRSKVEGPVSSKNGKVNGRTFTL
jgi:hypothetical protein